MPTNVPLAVAINDSNFIVTVVFSVIGLVITAVLMFCFPNLGAIIAECGQI